MLAVGGVGLIVSLILAKLIKKEINSSEQALALLSGYDEIFNQLITNNGSYTYKYKANASYPVILLTSEQIKNIRLKHTQYESGFFFYMQIKDSGEYTINDVFFCLDGSFGLIKGSVLKMQTQVGCLPHMGRPIDYKPTP